MFASLPDKGASNRRATPMQTSVWNTNSTTPASTMPHSASHREARCADFVVDAAERQHYDEQDHEQREEIQEALDRDRAEEGARRHREEPPREHGARDLADVREDVIAREAREYRGLQGAPGCLCERRDEVLPALGLHAVVSEEADTAEGNLPGMGTPDFGGESGPVEPADGEVEEERAKDGAEEKE